MDRLNEAKEQLDLGAWLEQYDETKDGGRHELRLHNCPVCGDDRYKLYVNVEIQRWICMHCDWGRHMGDVCQLMAEVSGRHLTDIRVELLKTVVPTPPASEFEARLETALNPAPPKRERNIEKVALPGSDQFTGVVGQRVLTYAHSRGVTDAEIRRHRLRAAYRLRRYPGPYLVFPVFVDGDLSVSWQGRTVGKVDPKYVSYDDISDWLWPINTIDQVEIHANPDRSVILVEGVFDAMACRRIGLPALCTFGKKIGRHQRTLLSDMNVRRVILAWDANAVADIERAALRLASQFRVSVADLGKQPPGHQQVDPGKVLEEPALEPWLEQRLTEVIDYGTPEFYQWRLLHALS